MAKKGGSRPGAGAHKKPDKKVQLPIYVLESQIARLGKVKIREISINAINNYKHD